MPEEDRDLARRELETRLKNASLSSRFRWKLGRRGAFLVVMGALYCLLGYGYGFKELPTSSIRQLEMPILVAETLSFHQMDNPMLLWGIVWCVAGVIAIFTAWWPPGADSWGFLILYSYAATWAVLNFAGAVALGAPRAEVIGFIFAAFAATVLIVSGMADPSPLSHISSEDDEDVDPR